MGGKFICGGNKFELGDPNVKAVIGLPVSVIKLPPKIEVEGCELYSRTKFHVSLVYIGQIIEKHKVSVFNFIDKVVEDFCDYTKNNEIKLLRYRDEFRFVSRGDRKSVVVKCDVSNLSEFFNLMNKKYDLQVECTPTHVTLYTLQPDVGISLTDSGDIQQLTKVIANPLGIYL
jgi:hypothetical protein